jgi:hypothetical protein
LGKNGRNGLATVLQRLYDSEINLTITTLWDGGYDFRADLIQRMGGGGAAYRLRENVYFS